MKAVNTVICHKCNRVVPVAPGFCVLCGIAHVEAVLESMPDTHGYPMGEQAPRTYSLAA